MKTATKDILPVLKGEVTTLEEQIADLVVNDEVSLAQASDLIKATKDICKKIEEEKKRFTAPAKEIISAAKAKYDPLIIALERIEDAIKAHAKSYMLEREAQRKEAEAKIAARVEKGTLKAETAMKKIDALPTDQLKAQTADSALRIQKRRDVEVMALNLLTPIEVYNLAMQGYLVWDMVKVRKEALEGDKIVGVKVIEKDVIQSF